MFWQDAWSTVKGDLLEMFKDFHANGVFTKSFNATFIILIPKKREPKDIWDFRPISLVESRYKLLAKVLVNRLKKEVRKVVSKDQNTFVRGRQIIDAS